MTHGTDHPTDDSPSIGSDTPNRIDRTLLDVLVCPITRGPLEYDKANDELISRQAGKAFPIKQGVPIMLVEEARDIDPA